MKFHPSPSSQPLDTDAGQIIVAKSIRREPPAHNQRMHGNLMSRIAAQAAWWRGREENMQDGGNIFEMVIAARHKEQTKKLTRAALQGPSLVLFV